jgi:hypothetical protein
MSESLELTASSAASGDALLAGDDSIPTAARRLILMRRGDLSGSQAMSVVVFKGLVHTVVLALAALISLLPWVDSPITSLQRWFLLGATGLVLAVWLVAWLWLRRPLGRALVPARLHGKLDELIGVARSFGVVSCGTVFGLVGLQLVYWTGSP